ncbi:MULTISPECIES: hypothetical protein [Microbacterium]|uniref:Uncharacterized protein n=1 Tax=Microbacterium wangchenii TaxID=2541726 RepID=A0ABX5STL3_9MICO|nr:MULTISPECIES: hypothetical protein [Microbacterium]MCK6065727.1 hypothetical protein [Microbacterium sp. EYE_512]QBR89132.1 hypothetical protein E4K62_10815 [Microbacterium wangchenii]TXK08993.1 hypothetical protein FVP99_18510 [Microbacterium wangchenii]
MRSIMVSTPPRRSILRPIARWGWTVPVAAAVVVVALTVGPIAATPSYAATPPPLTIQPLDDTIDDVLSESLDILRAATATRPSRDAEVVRWSLREDGTDDPVIVPEWQEWVWNADGTGYLSARAGAPYSVTTDGKIVEPVGDAPDEGDPIETARSSPSDFGFFPDEPPANAREMRDYLTVQAHLPNDADALAWWGAISLLRDEWTLTADQQAAALEILAATGGLSVLGTVEDRFGRDGIALSVTSANRDQFGATVVLDEASRQIIAADITYNGGSNRLDLDTGSVIEYSAWLLPR